MCLTFVLNGFASYITEKPRNMNDLHEKNDYGFIQKVCKHLFCLFVAFMFFCETSLDISFRLHYVYFLIMLMLEYFSFLGLVERSSS